MDMRSGASSPQDFTWRGFTLAPAATICIRELVVKQPGMIGARPGVRQTGCASFGHALDSVSEPNKDNPLLKHDGTKLLAPLQAMPFVDGTEVDSVREGLNQIFKFHNPKAQNECGCDESSGVQAVLCLIVLKQLTMSGLGPAAR